MCKKNEKKNLERMNLCLFQHDQIPDTGVFLTCASVPCVQQAYVLERMERNMQRWQDDWKLSQCAARIRHRVCIRSTFAFCRGGVSWSPEEPKGHSVTHKIPRDRLGPPERSEHAKGHMEELITHINTTSLTRGGLLLLCSLTHTHTHTHTHGKFSLGCSSYNKWYNAPCTKRGKLKIEN